MQRLPFLAFLTCTLIFQKTFGTAFLNKGKNNFCLPEGFNIKQRLIKKTNYMIKRITTIIAASALALSVQAQVGPEISSWVINTTGATGYNSLPSNVQQVQYTSTDVYVSASCIPGYAIGPWNSNPNTPSNQNFVFKITRNPTQNTGTAVTTP